MVSGMSWRHATSVMLCASALTGCRAHDLEFVKERPVQLLVPAENARVSLPFELHWSTRGGGSSRVAVIFDQPTMAAGQTLLSLVPRLDPCRGDAGCPDADWLHDHYIYVCSGSTVSVAQLPDLRKGRRSTDVHQATIVAIDDSGRRLNESAAILNFTVERSR